MKKFSWLVISHLLAVLVGAGVTYYYAQQQEERLRSELTVYQDSLNRQRDEATRLRSQLELCRLRGLAGEILAHVQAQNYGSAREVATRFFDHLSQAIQQQLAAGSTERLQEIYNRRDEIMADLGGLNPRVEQKLREIYLSLPAG